MLFLITYGKGKVFHIPLGHDGPGGGPLHCVGYQTILARGTEYVATAKVTIGIPDSFPTKEKAVVIAPDKVKWPARVSPRDEIIGKRSAFTKKVEVFGLHIYATNTTETTSYFMPPTYWPNTSTTMKTVSPITRRLWMRC